MVKSDYYHKDWLEGIPEDRHNEGLLFDELIEVAPNMRLRDLREQSRGALHHVR